MLNFQLLKEWVYKYTFPKSNNANIILDLEHRDKVIESEIHINSKMK